MDSELFIQNIKDYCRVKGESPTSACKNAGVGSSFISDIKRGQTPSVTKVQLLADYLGTTTSKLLGEKEPPVQKSDGWEQEAIQMLRALPENTRLRELAYLRECVNGKDM